MQIVRTEQETGGNNRTPREEIVPLNTGTREVEPENYLDCSESEGWPWDSDPSVCTWAVQLPALRGFIVPFEGLDSQAAGEQAGGDDEKGGVYCYPFSHEFLPIGHGDDDGDLNSSNFEEKMAAFMRKYFGGADRPQSGGTQIMAAVKAGDKHFMDEFRKDPRGERPVRARTVWTDGQLKDADAFRRYLAQATPTPEGYGSHKDWDEVWGIAILGEPGGGGHAAYEQYVTLAKDHPWIHAYYFEGVTNPDEVAEDMAVAVVPAKA